MTEPDQTGDERRPLLQDQEILSVATKFVAEIIEKAKAEAAKRLKVKKLGIQHLDHEKGKKELLNSIKNIKSGPNIWKKRWTNFVGQVYRVFWSCLGSTYYS